MNNIKTKVSLVYIPYLLITITCIILCNLISWLFETTLRFLSVDYFILNFGVPALLIGIAIILFLRKRIHVLSVAGKDDKGYSFYQFIAWISIFASTTFSQHYLSKATQNLVAVNTCEDIDLNNIGRYYDIKSVYIDKNRAIADVRTSTSGKYGQRLNFHMFFACPIGTSINEGVYWYGVSYHDEMSNRGTEIKKQEGYESFIEESSLYFNNHQFKEPYFYENIPNNRDRKGYYSAIKRKYDVENHRLLILEPVFEPFEKRTAKSLYWFFISLVAGLTVFFIMIAIPSVNERNYESYKHGTLLKEDWIVDTLKWTLPIKPHKETSVLIDMILLFFIILVFSEIDIMSPSSGDLFPFGAVSWSSVLDGEWWRLISSLFIHAGPFHLINNLVSLAICGHLLEVVVKKGMITAVFILTGVLGTLISFIWLPDTQSVGASGGIFGLFGLMLSLLMRKKIPLEAKMTYYLVLVLFAGFSLVIGFLLPQVNNAAHLGGLISGLFLGFVTPVKPLTTNRVD